MDSEVKWYMIGMAVIMTGMFCSFAYSDHVKSECRIDAIEAHMLYTDIERICN